MAELAGESGFSLEDVWLPSEINQGRCKVSQSEERSRDLGGEGAKTPMAGCRPKKGRENGEFRGLAKER